LVAGRLQIGDNGELGQCRAPRPENATPATWAGRLGR
jgi:hypothetical protein